MAESRSISVPPWFNSIVASATSESLEDLSVTVRKELDDGLTPEAVAGGLVETGWDSNFSEWYVQQVAECNELLLLQAGFVAYPRGSRVLHPESAEDLRIVVRSFQQVNLALLVWLVGSAAFVVVTFSVYADSGVAMYVIQLACQAAATVMATGACLRAGKAMKWNRSVTVMFAVFLFLVPCGTFLFLVSATSRFQEYLRKAGVKVGFLGPDPDSVRAAILARSNGMPATVGPDDVQR